MIQEYWFDSLKIAGLRNHHLWLGNLPSQVERIANFGCWSGGEPFALLWTLDAKEIMVVEIEEKNIKEFRSQKDALNNRYPESLQGCTVNYICGNMTTHLSELPDQYYDLAYCEDVLYTLQGNRELLERGITQMIRVVKPKGLIIAVEPKFGAQFETRNILGIQMSVPNQVSEPKNMSDLFSSNGLNKIEVLGCPPYAYCYGKNHN